MVEPNPEPDPGLLLEGTHHVRLATSLGTIDLELYADDAPKAVTNFVTHTNDGYYTGMVFHRVIDDFMIQGGDPTGTGRGGESIYGGAFNDEFNELGMARGILAMANAGPDTNGSQFFIVQAAGGAPHLIGKHTAFGKVTTGLDVLDAIAGVATDTNDRPLTPVTFTAEPLP